MISGDEVLQGQPNFFHNQAVVDVATQWTTMELRRGLFKMFIVVGMRGVFRRSVILRQYTLPAGASGSGGG